MSRRPASGCTWEIFDEVSPFGSTERHVLDASRRVCRNGQALGTIVVRVMLDYRTLPFISSQSPYLESLRPAHQQTSEGAPGRDIEFVAYGWSRGPLYASGTGVWPLPDATFQRMVSSRDPFWTTLTRDDRDYRVYFASDRGGIVALGYPSITWLGRLVAFAELVTLTGVLYVVLLAGGTLFDTLTSRTPTTGQALMDEVRTSFYRKLFLAFVLAAVVPVATLALATQTYFAAELRAGIEDAAARTATVAERLVEDYATLQQRGVGPIRPLDNQIMVLVGRAIDEDVNLFNRAHLQATSERDLFASRLLSARTPASVYRAIVLDRQSTFVGVERVGDFSYLLAAAPVRAGDQQGIVTVPVTLRQQEIEREIDELDRRVLVAAVLFVLFGGALGYWMAERIADPVSRLTRVTRAYHARQPRRVDGRDLGRRARSPDRRFQQDGARAEAPASRARAHAAARGLGGYGASGGARHQEPADANPAVGRTRPPHQRRPGQSAVADSRQLRERYSFAGAAAASDRHRVLELRLLADAAAGTGGRRAASRRARVAVSRRPG